MFNLIRNSQHPCEISLILKTSRPRLREVKHLDQDHTTRKQRSCDSNWYLSVCAVCSVTQLCSTICDATNCSLPGSFVHVVISHSSFILFYHFYFVRQLWLPLTLCFWVAYAETATHKMDYFVAENKICIKLLLHSNLFLLFFPFHLLGRIV